MVRVPASRRRRLVAPLVLAATAAALVPTLASGPASAAAACTVDYQIASQWDTGFQAGVNVTTPNGVSGWTLTWTFGGNQRITQAWNSTVTQPVGQATVTAQNLSWNAGSPSFGFIASYSGSNPVPTNFALNGTACGGGATMPPPTSPPPTSPPPTTPPPTMPPPTSPPPTSPPPTTPPPTTPPAGCGAAVICDNVEGQTGTAPSGAWSVMARDCAGTGTATVDSTVAHSGTRSFRVDGRASFCNHAFVGRTDIGTVGSVVFGRFWVRHSTALPDSHVTIMAMRDTGDANKDLRMGGQNRAMQWNRESDDATLPAQSPAGVAQSVPLPTNAWTCVEFMVDGPAGQERTWVNGTEVVGLRDDGVPTQDVDAQWLGRAWHPALADFRLGWESYSTGDDTLWFDDIALGRTRIGC